MDCRAAQKCPPAEFWMQTLSSLCNVSHLRYIRFAQQPALTEKKTCCSLLQCIMKGCKWANLQLWQHRPRRRRPVIGSEVPLQRPLWWGTLWLKVGIGQASSGNSDKLKTENLWHLSCQESAKVTARTLRSHFSSSSVPSGRVFLRLLVACAELE